MLPPSSSSSSEASSSFIIRRRVRRRNSSTNQMMTMMMMTRLVNRNRVKPLVATGSIIVIVALLWTASRGVQRGGEAVTAGHLRGSHGRGAEDRSLRIHPHTQPFNENSIASKATNLIIVAGHSVLISNNVQNAPYDDSTWFLYDYQQHRGLPNAIVRHIQAGIQLAILDPAALLVFSGGQTRAITGPESEGASYYRVSDTLHLWNGRDVFINDNSNDINDDPTATTTTTTDTTTTTVRARTTSEDFATDSFENFMFSICRFREVTGRYPNNISVVSFTFKQERFETLHANALHWPIDHFHYVGIDPPASSTGFDLAVSMEGEKNNSLLPFKIHSQDWHRTN